MHERKVNISNPITSSARTGWSNSPPFCGIPYNVVAFGCCQKGLVGVTLFAKHDIPYSKSQVFGHVEDCEAITTATIF